MKRYKLFYIALLVMIVGLSYNLHQMKKKSTTPKWTPDAATTTARKDSFDQLVVSAPVAVSLNQAGSERIRIEASTDMLPHIKTEIRDGTLFISVDEEALDAANPDDIKISLNMPNVRRLAVEGSGRVNANRIKAKELALLTNGDGQIEIQSLRADNLRADLDGTSSCSVFGKVNQQSINVLGSSQYNAPELACDTVEVCLKGTGGAKVHAQKALDVRMSGTGSVEYLGTPQISKTIVGTGRVSPAGTTS